MFGLQARGETMAGKKNKNNYRPDLVVLMAHCNGISYTVGAQFTPDELVRVTADDVVSFFKEKVYGTPTPTDNDHPIKSHSASLY